MGRRLSEPLLLHPSALTDEDHDADVNAKIADRESQQAAYNHHTRELNELPVGSPVRVQDQSTKDWGTLAHVTDQVGPRSYEVTTSDGAVLRRNRQHLKPSVMCDASKPPPEEPASAAASPPAPDESADGSPPDDSPAVRRGTRALVITETWLCEGNLDSVALKDMTPNGYSVQHLPRPNSRGRGLALIHVSGVKLHLAVPPISAGSLKRRRSQPKGVARLQLHRKRPRCCL
ncbi:hypothetical protein CAPTEDRAFT_199668 [Capitella teleta]|uniref:Uncharacterized protein n=1 Tax=Capitella teleta TaxID=283909 RepID=R7U8I9_CAPTE|nr:hypothetical protein CAPTEDRAFT_199668 [Capitella teleta]|eukprot:ELU02695.1 hypothetical protein CAPTEDRAFT_199668 [Capitella teleta]